MKKPLSLLTIIIFATFINPVFSGESNNIFNPDMEILSYPDTDLVLPNPLPAISEKFKQSQALENAPVHGYTSEQKQLMTLHNDALLKSAPTTLMHRVAKYRPYADYEKTGYLIMSADFDFSSRQAKLELAKNLPSDAFLIIFASNASERGKEYIYKSYSEVLSKERIKVIELINTRNGFWARDGIPVPVMDAANNLTVIDAKYYHYFEPDAEISKLLKTGLESHEYYFEGGNFQANHKGACIIVNCDYHSKIPDSIFNELYGCKDIIRLPHLSGIGHIDEHARFINENTLVTDLPQYKEILEKKGFTIHMLPRPAKKYETYVNSLIMNDRVIVPVFDEATDAQALGVYEKLGLKASGADSKRLSNAGRGSVHCITMTYPKIPMPDLLKILGAKEL